MDPEKLRALIDVLKAAGVTYYNSPELELRFGPAAGEQGNEGNQAVTSEPDALGEAMEDEEEVDAPTSMEEIRRFYANGGVAHANGKPRRPGS